MALTLRKPEYTPGEILHNDEEYVLIRTTSAGLWHAIISSLEGDTATVVDARNIWRWRGANTINEISLYGIQPASEGYSRVSEPVEFKTLIGVIDITPCTEAATRRIKECGWAA